MLIAGGIYEPTDFAVVMETSISLTVRWKAGCELQTFLLEYKESGTESGN